MYVCMCVCERVYVCARVRATLYAKQKLTPRKKSERRKHNLTFLNKAPLCTTFVNPLSPLSPAPNTL